MVRLALLRAILENERQISTYPIIVNLTKADFSCVWQINRPKVNTITHTIYSKTLLAFKTYFMVILRIFALKTRKDQLI